MPGMIRAASADSKKNGQLESGCASLEDVPISVCDFALSVSQDLPAKLTLQSKLEDFSEHCYNLCMPWTAVWSAASTTWSRGKFGITARRSVLTYTFIAVLLSMACPPQTSQIVDSIATLSTTLRILVGILLGLFLLASSFIWQMCLSGFCGLLDTIQRLQMQFISLECADEEHAQTAVRYGLLSAHLLNAELSCEARGGMEWKQALAEMQSQVSVPMGKDSKCGLAHFGLLCDKELKILMEVEDSPGMIWVWVASLLGRLAQDGSIPSMESCTFEHIASLTQSAQERVRQVRSCAAGQTACTFVRMLTVAVRASNLLSAISFGMFLGTYKRALISAKDVPTSVVAAEFDSQAILVAFFLGVCAPVLYQAVLEVAVLIALPFASKHEEAPANELISRLESNLQEASVLTQHLHQPGVKMLSAQ